MNSISAATNLRPAENDYDLLQLSALAAGITIEYRRGSDAYYYDDPETGREQWHPLSDDGQALRLAVQLRIAVEFDPGSVDDACAYAFACGRNFAELLNGDDNADHGAATRRAIVRAAAEIGRARAI